MRKDQRVRYLTTVIPKGDELQVYRMLAVAVTYAVRIAKLLAPQAATEMGLEGFAEVPAIDEIPNRCADEIIALDSREVDEALVCKLTGEIGSHEKDVVRREVDDALECIHRFPREWCTMTRTAAQVRVLSQLEIRVLYVGFDFEGELVKAWRPQDPSVCLVHTPWLLRSD